MQVKCCSLFGPYFFHTSITLQIFFLLLYSMHIEEWEKRIITQHKTMSVKAIKLGKRTIISEFNCKWVLHTSGFVLN